MRLQYKINIISLGILVAVACALTAVGVTTMDRLTWDLNRKLLAAETAQTLDKIAEAYGVLADSGVAAVSSYVEQAQKDLFRDFAGRRGESFGRMSIIAPPANLILDQDQSPGAALDLPCLPDMLQKGEGQVECRFQGKTRLLFYRHFPEWNWLVILSATDEEMFAMRDTFLRSVLAILAASLVVGGVILVSLTRGIVGPLQRLAQAAKALSRGEWRQSLPEPRAGDEVGELTRAFAEMSQRLEEAHGDLEARAQDLRRVNVDLNREVEERRRAEEELARLNRDLEQLVAERTAELEGKARELKEANRRLLELDELKSAFLSSVSHELRTPLTSVLGFTKLITRDFQGSFLPLAGDEALRKKAERIHGNLHIIEQEGERLTRLINDFLDLTKIESGHFEWFDREIAPRDVIQRAVQAVRGLYAQNPLVELVAELEEGLPAVFADADRLEQVLINILNNAAKFTAQGRVALRAGRAPDGFLRLSVSDTGVGIPESELDKIFDKFHQVVHQDTLLEKPKGTGLGLAICRQIVRHYGGRIWAESEPGRGSTFTVELPPALAAVRPAPAPAVEPAPGMPLILVVDDDPAICSYLSQIFQDAGFGVLTAADGRSGLELARQRKPDLITMDILMPGLDGKEAIAKLRRDPELSGVPVLVISVLQEESFGGESASLRKPVDPGQLLDAVYGLLNRACPEQPLVVLRRNGPEVLAPFFALCQEKITHCTEEELWKEIAAGFQGTVVVPGWAAGVLDLSALRGRKGVHVLIMPEPRGTPSRK